MKILIKKYKSLENLEISVPAQIGAGNGLGKSTILEAISFVLTGKDLSGNEFKQVYDNRVDIHDAIAAVSYFDNYGNEFQRIVKPIFQTNRAGIEEIKIKRSTECRKNSIPCNDFSDDFVDFYKFGTDYFFNQKEDLQRSIFIDILKSKMPEYDVNSASLKLKELKRSQKIEVDAVKSLQDANKNTKDVEVPITCTEIEKRNNEYISLTSSSNPEAVAEINKKNNKSQSDWLDLRFKSRSEIDDVELKILTTTKDIESEKQKLETVKSAKFTPKELQSTELLEKDVSDCYLKMDSLEFYETIEHYAQENFTKNPVLVENQKKIVELMTIVFVPSGEISSACPLNNQDCPTAKLHSEASEQTKFNVEKVRQISDLKLQNRSILEKEIYSVNSEYNAVKSDLQEAERKLNKLIESNKLVESDNLSNETIFNSTTKLRINEIEKQIIELNKQLIPLNSDFQIFKERLSNLVEPTPEKLPEQLEISDKLKEAHAAFELLKIDINKAQGVNEHNKDLLFERSIEIKTKQSGLLEIIEQITTLTTEISDYFNNLKEIVKQEFSGDIEIDAGLLEFVMSRDEYKDCFKITANGKVFPYECNGALQNNVKLQILFNLQRLKDYKGITVMDNCEANTTQPINTLGLNCVLAFATNDKELIIK